MKLRQSIYIIFTVFILLLSLPILGINTIFHYSNFNESYKLTFETTEESKEVPESLVKDFSAEANVTKIDTINRSITFQNTNEESIRDLVENKLENPETITYKISLTYPTNTEPEVINNILSAVAIIVIISLLTSIYFVFHKSTAKRNLITIGFLSLIFVSGVVTSFIIQLVIMSVFSRIYQISELDVLTLLIAGMWTCTIGAMALLSLRTNTVTSSLDFIESLRNVVAMLRKYKVGTVLFIILPLFIGLGSQFVIPGILLASALLLPIPSFLTIIRVIDRANQRKRIQKNQANSKTTPKAKQEAVKKNKSATNTPWKNRFKKKKKV